MRNLLIRLWRLENTPILQLETQETCSVTQYKCKGLRTRGAVVQVPVQGEDKMRCLAQADRIKGQMPPSSAFCSVQDLNRLHDAHPHWEDSLPHWVH